MIYDGCKSLPRYEYLLTQDTEFLHLFGSLLFRSFCWSHPLIHYADSPPLHYITRQHKHIGSEIKQAGPSTTAGFRLGQRGKQPSAVSRHSLIVTTAELTVEAGP